MVSKNISLMSVFFALFLTGCIADDFVRARIEGTALNPVIHMKERMNIEQIEVNKIEDAGSENATPVIYWFVVANNDEQIMYDDKVQYGDNPNGWQVITPARQLEEGYYAIDVAEGHRLSMAGFLIVRNSAGGLSLIGIDEPYSYSDGFFKCVDEHSYIENEVKSNCLKERYLRKK